MVHYLSMDPLAAAAEIAAVLQAAETVPAIQRRRVPRKERQETYLAYQHEAYRLMAGVSHLSILAQMRAISWRTMGVAAIPMIGPFADTVLPSESSKNPFIRLAQELLRNAASLTKEMSPSAGEALASTYTSEIRLRDRILTDTAAVRDVSGDFLAALAKVRLLGRPEPVAAADVILSLLQSLIARIPTQDDRPLYRRISQRSGQIQEERLREFNNCMTALGKAHVQFISAVRTDRPGRHYSWQVWRRAIHQVQPATELLAQAGLPSSVASDARSMSKSLHSPSSS